MRIKILKIMYVMLLVAVAARLFYWQIIRFDDLTARAEQQHVVNSSIEAPRGTIYSLDNAILATNKPTYLVYGLPKTMADKDSVSLKLAEIIFQEESEFEDKSNKEEFQELRQKLLKSLSQDLYWVSLYPSIEFETKAKIEKLKLVGVGFDEKTTRYYPEASSAAHILGFVGADANGRNTGYFGLEGFYNGELQGKGGTVREERDAKGLPILMGKFLKLDAIRGYNLKLNIDRSVQYIVEKKLKAGMIKYGAKSGSVVVMDPHTGAILAMAAYPNYDPSNFSLFPRDFYRNPIVAGSYEPGSTFKVLTMAAAVNEDVVEADTKCDNCEGPVQMSGHMIRTWNSKYKKDLTMTEAIIHSDNTGMVFMSRKLGLDKLFSYIQEYGFGTLTQIDLQDETSPDLRPKSEWRDIDLATASFGQGIAVTPIQMVRAVSIIANGGKLMEPQMVKEIISKDKTIVIPPKVIATPLKQETTQIIKEMMVQAVAQGESRVFAPKGYRIAGKTGTAQIPIAGHYDPNKTVASFVGFAPADDPKFVMLVRYDEPTSSIYGAETAAPTFFEIAKELFPYYNVAPTE